MEWQIKHTVRALYNDDYIIIWSLDRHVYSSYKRFALDSIIVYFICTIIIYYYYHFLFFFFIFTSTAK